MFNMTIVALLSFLGVIGGYFLVLIAPEEIEPGYKYFVIFQNLLLSSLIASIIIVFFNSKYVSFFAIGISLFVFYFLYRYNFAQRIFVAVPVVFVFLREESLVIFFMALIVVLGMGISTVQGIDYVKNEKIKKKKEFLLHLLKYHALYFLFALLPLFISES